MRAHPYQLERPVIIGGKPRWEKFADVWAQAWQKRGRLITDTGGAELRITHEVRLRALDGLVPGMRLRRNTRALLIHQVDDVDGAGRFLLCHCEEQTPLLRLATADTDTEDTQEDTEDTQEDTNDDTN